MRFGWGAHLSIHHGCIDYMAVQFITLWDNLFCAYIAKVLSDT